MSLELTPTLFERVEGHYQSLIAAEYSSKRTGPKFSRDGSFEDLFIMGVDSACELGDMFFNKKANTEYYVEECLKHYLAHMTQFDYAQRFPVKLYLLMFNRLLEVLDDPALEMLKPKDIATETAKADVKALLNNELMTKIRQRLGLKLKKKQALI